MGKFTLFWITFEKKIFSFLGRYVCVWLKSLQKNANMTQKIFFSNDFDMGIKNAEFDADFESVKKVVKKFQWK